MCMCMCIFTDANFNISTALLTSAGLFKILKGRWRHPQGDKTSPKFLYILDVSLTSQELVDFLFTRMNVLTLQYVFQKSYTMFTSDM